MRRTMSVSLLVAGFLLAPAMADDETARERAGKAARSLGQALRENDLSLLRAILPKRGKIQLRLVRLGPEEGFFSSSQVEALLQDFLNDGSVRSFDLLRTEQGPSGFGIAYARAMVTDRDGRVARLALHLVFEPEDDRWVLREMRESEP